MKGTRRGRAGQGEGKGEQWTWRITVQRLKHLLRSRPLRLLLLLLLIPLGVYLYLSRRSFQSRIPFHHPLPGALLPLNSTTQHIPPYLHYVYGLSPDFGGHPFAFIQWLCLTSALHLLHPEIIYFHYVHEPSGWYWDQWVRAVEEKPGTRLEMRRERDVTEVFGNEVVHFAHKADVLRLEVLRDFGGVYLDVDVLVIKDLAPLYTQEVVMGMESQPNLDPALPPSGLCNAVILAKPNSSFILRWIDTYRTFDKDQWAKHSVTTPWTLAHEHPSELTVLNKFAFFWPLWHDDHLRLVHRSTAYSFHRAPALSPSKRDTQFTYHLWDSLASPRYLSPYTPDRIHNRGMKRGKEREEDGASDESSFSREGRRWVTREFRRKWREAKRKGLVV